LGGRLQPEDGPLVRIAAEWFVTWTAAAAKLATEEIGTLTYARTLSAVSVASQRFEACVKRLGMSPADREMMTLPDPTSPKAVRW
jgi:hypothetical protein